MINETWDVYDKHRIKTGRTLNKSNFMDEYKEGDCLMEIHICIFNEKGEMLIQQRQSTKPYWPDLWDVTAAGASVSGESSQDAAHRELFEELGLDIDFSELRPDMTVNSFIGFDDIYLLKREVDLESLTFQEEEVQDACWASKEKILEMIDSGEFFPYFREYINLWFAVCGRDGFLEE